MRDGLGLVEQALLEADVSYSVVNDFIDRVTEEAVGERSSSRSIPPSKSSASSTRSWSNLMGPVDHSLHLKPDATVLMLCGLQGSGKTTTCGKLGRMIKERGRSLMLVAADLQRPAAIEQLHVIGEQLGIPVYSEPGANDPVAVCQNAVRQAQQREHRRRDPRHRRPAAHRRGADGAARADRHAASSRSRSTWSSTRMTGQDAVNSAKAFNEALELDGVIMTKLDGDARGGAALSVKAVTGVPIKFIGIGEHLDALEEFHPERMAGRILGMGDILTLVEQAQQKFDQDEMQVQEERMRKGRVHARRLPQATQDDPPARPAGQSAWA